MKCLRLADLGIPCKLDLSKTYSEKNIQHIKIENHQAMTQVITQETLVAKAAVLAINEATRPINNGNIHSKLSPRTRTLA